MKTTTMMNLIYRKIYKLTYNFKQQKLKSSS